jgi:putative ABC transport system permease protein
MSLAMQPLMASVELTLILKPTFFGQVFVGTVALCLLASAISFRKIASLDPALVFRS